MPRVTKVLRRARKALEDLDLLKILESELNHELSSMRYQDDKIGSLGDFVLEWDSPQSQNVEVAISALLGRDTFQGDGRLPREALMKICFDCVASKKGGSEPDFDIQNAHYIPSSLRQYLAARGIEENFTNSVLLHLHKKEQGQYMGWLQKLKNMMVEHE
ncbi:hypothetical protein Pfo_028269 [Paulownia fortunei]|nr:hypothetical protein Pfo_028269 [Paulownia fortunei]